MKHNMSVNYKGYCDHTVCEQISLVGFMGYFSFVNDKQRILGLWTGSVVPYLLSHSSKGRRQAGARLNKIGRNDLDIIVDRELQNREHARVMLPQVAKQQQAIGELNTALTRQFAASEVQRIELELEKEDHIELGSTPRSGTSSARRSKRSARLRADTEESKEPIIVDKLDQQDKASRNKRMKRSHVGDSSSSMSASAPSPKPRHDRGRNSNLSTGGDIFVPEPYVDVSSFKVYNYQIGESNIGQLFHRFQEDSFDIVNNFEITVSLSNISKFLAMNFIFTIFEGLQGLTQDVLQVIQQAHTWPVAHLDRSTLLLCSELDQQLATGEPIQADADSSEQRKIILLYSMLELKMPVQHNLFSKGLEDTFCHQVIDALVSFQFPARSAIFSVDWANGEAHGSKKRRGHGYRPDACIKKHGRQIAFLEVKPPGDSHTVKEYLWDYWNLANYTKDAIDLFLQEGLPIVKAAAVQLFRHQICLYIMEYTHGLYHWNKICTAYVPRDQSDSGIAGCVRLFRTLESVLDQINTNVLPQTPPQIDYDGKELQENRGRPSKVTPSERKNMF